MEEIKPYNISLVSAVLATFFRMYKGMCIWVSVNWTGAFSSSCNLKGSCWSWCHAGSTAPENTVRECGPGATAVNRSIISPCINVEVKG